MLQDKKPHSSQEHTGINTSLWKPWQKPTTAEVLIVLFSKLAYEKVSNPIQTWQNAFSFSYYLLLLGKESLLITTKQWKIQISLRCRRHKLQKGKCQLDIMKNIFYRTVVKHLKSLPREIVGAPSLEILRVQLAVSLKTIWLLDWSCPQQGFGADDLQRSPLTCIIPVLTCAYSKINTTKKFSDILHYNCSHSNIHRMKRFPSQTSYWSVLAIRKSRTGTHSRTIHRKHSWFSNPVF